MKRNSSDVETQMGLYLNCCETQLFSETQFCKT